MSPFLDFSDSGAGTVKALSPMPKLCSGQSWGNAMRTYESFCIWIHGCALRDTRCGCGSDCIPDAGQIKLLALEGLNVALAGFQAARVREAK